MKSLLAIFLSSLPLLVRAQSDAATNKIPVVIYVSSANASLIADFQSNGVPVDTIIVLGAKAALNQAKGRLLEQINHMTLSQLSAAYPQMLSIMDTNAPQTVQEQQLRTLALMQLSRVKTSGDANRVYSLNYSAQQVQTKDSCTNPPVFTTPQPFQMSPSTNSSQR